MPYRSAASSENRGTFADITQPRLVNATRKDEDSDVGADIVPGLRLPSAGQGSAMTTTAAVNDAAHNTTKASIASRRRQSSIPNAKGVMGPRPLDFQTKRAVSGTTAHPFGSLRGASAIASQDAHTNEFSINDVSQFSFASIDPTKTVPLPKQREVNKLQGGDFVEPKFDFDDFHDNIIAGSPRIDTFPITGSNVSPIAVLDVPMPKIETRRFPIQPAIPVPTRKTSGAGALARKGSGASTTSRINLSKPDSMSQTSTQTSILRGRRQSHFPPNAFNNAPTAKPPRKSIGPGTFVNPDLSEESEVRRRPSINGRKSSTESNKSTFGVKVVTQDDDANPDTQRSPKSARIKSSLAPNRTSSKDLLNPSKTPDGLRISSLTVTTPNRRSGTPGRTTTPGGTNRRMSVATGLGARTISPTDARRMKRMSTVPPAPPLPQTRISEAPPTPQPDIMIPPRPLSAAQSPAATQRKSMTPSSSRTTPDPNRKSYSSGQSLSSNTSINSTTRNSTTINTRLVTNLSTSRLPTPKPRTETGGTPTEEIPPVPAIPKSYESPASEYEQPYFSARSSSLQQDDTQGFDSPRVSSAAEAFAKLGIPFDINIPSQMIWSQSSSGQPSPVELIGSPETVVSGRQPPFGLLPLSAPTMEKIRAFKASAERPETPPELQKMAPSTPMTASKATFFAGRQRNTVDGQNNLVRSNTSHFVIRSDDQDTGDGVSPSLPAFAFETDLSTSRSMSPFLSSSLPKSSNEYPNSARMNFGTELKRSATQARPNGPRAPSYSLSTKVNESTPVSDKTTDSSATASTTSLLPTLSNKQSNNNLIGDSTAKYGAMPPPKLPASATWNNLTNASKPAESATQKQGFFRTRRKTSASSTTTLNTLTGPERHESFDSAKTHISNGRPSLDSVKSLMQHSNRSGSLLSSTTNSKIAQPRPQEPELDRDDQVAEEEMKKLASKRRDFESAARQLDSLRARARPATRMSANTALHNTPLNIYERGEIVDFADVFFTGTMKAKKIIGDLSSSSTNFGYDDDRGDYNIIEGDHLAYRYEVVDVLGKGSFGQVVRCVDHKTGILVAIKIIRNKKRFHQQALVEVEILQKLKEWDPQKKYNVVSFDQSFYFRGHLCISTDLLNMNLYEFIKAHDFRGFSLKLIRRFTKQMLSSLVLLHGKKVIHCDLKPENILLAHPAHSEIKVIDFGSSCFENEKVYTYIQSRFYRSPEVILGMSYGMPIDMWSLGCILAELFTGYPIFPGENEQEQLACIMEIFGPPEKHLIEKSSRKKLFFDSMGKPRLTVSSKGRRRRPSSKDLRQVLKCDDEAFLDFIARCLRWDPARRMTPHEAGRHEFITGIKPPTINARSHLTKALSTPLKRNNSTAAAGGARPLPQPPSSSGLKPTVGTRQDSLTASPNKVGPGPRRQSNMTSNLQVSAQAKRASHAAMNPAATSSSSLSRLTLGQRTASSRSDLATAAAAASLVK